MAVYRIYSEKDSFIWDEPSISGKFGNAGKDEILEVGTYLDLSRVNRKKRILIQFNTEDIKNSVDLIGTNSFESNLKMYLANASQIPQEFSLYLYPISSSWESGISKRSDSPYGKEGVNWEYRDMDEGIKWENLGGDYISSSLSSSQDFTLVSDLDLNIGVTEAIHSFYSESIDNNGFLIKLSEEIESSSYENLSLSYFGGDTNSIYPPVLEFKWDDSVYTEYLPELDTDLITFSISNLREEYEDSGKVRFRLDVRPKYPTRTFTTSSVYLSNYRLPENSYWAIKDEYTDEIIIDFDENYTKISADSKSNYFDVYLDTFQPERYYTILVKTTLDGSTIVYNENRFFKVSRNG